MKEICQLVVACCAMAAFVGHTDDADRCVRPLDRLPSNPPPEIC